MTKNVLEYLGIRETARSNLAKEAETQRSNMAKEAETRRYNDLQIQEMARHNAETERQNASALAEAARANRVNEAIAAQNATTKAREAMWTGVNATTRMEELKESARQANMRDVRSGDENANQLWANQTRDKELEETIRYHNMETGAKIGGVLGGVLDTIMRWSNH